MRPFSGSHINGYAQGPSSEDPYLEQLAQLASSVPDLASTLITQAEQEAEDDNISFLRTHLPEDEDNLAYDEAGESRRRMRRAVDAMVEPRVYTPAQLQELGEMQETSDVARPLPQQYHGWAPGASDDEGETHMERSERRLPQSSAALLDEHVMRRDEHLRERMRLRRMRDAAQLEWRDPTPREALTTHTPSPWDQPQHAQNDSEGIPTMTESSLRTTALLQAVRRNPQFSARSRNELQRYILDRERGDDRDHTPARANEPSNNAVSPSQRRQLRHREAGDYQDITPARANEPSNNAVSPSQRRQIHREATMRQEIQQHRDLLAEHQQHRNYLEEQLRHQRNGLAPASENRRRRYWQTSSPCAEKRRIDDAIKYLGKLRLCESDQEGQETAEEGGLDPGGCSPIHLQDFLVNTRLVPPPPESSWLKVGAVLSGTQHGASPSSLPSYTPLMPPSIYRSRTRNPHFGSVPPRTTSPVRQPPQANADGSAPPEEERWPVKVNIHSVDYNDMTLTGTMEAFNVPDKSSPTKVSSITTYLEGEIIDFNKFTLETESFKADTRVDGMYWRKLPPFKDLSDDEAMIRKLLSKEWLREELMTKWILMRWKGSSFRLWPLSL